MLQLNTFRLAGRSGCVNDISETFPIIDRIRAGRGYIRVYIFLDIYDCALVYVRKKSLPCRFGHQPAGSAVFKHVLNPCRRHLGIYWQISAPGFHDTENRDDDICRTIEHNTDDIVFADPFPSKNICKLICFLIKLPVCELRMSVYNGGPIRRFFGLLFKQLMKRHIFLLNCPAVFCFSQQQLPFGFRKHVNVRQLDVRVSTDRFDHVQKVAAPASDRFFLKYSSSIVKAQADFSIMFNSFKRQVELCRTVAHRIGGNLQISQSQRRNVHILHVEKHAEQRVSTRISRQRQLFNQLFKRIALLAKRLQARFFHFL
ncbi:hypothetical protein CHCC20335_2377 [Bacillus paralicheniformis]|nr:hypothetical protein CHCC20335_2377 [Bacillus paralicheniformis]